MTKPSSYKYAILTVVLGALSLVALFLTPALWDGVNGRVAGYVLWAAFLIPALFCARRAGEESYYREIDRRYDVR